MLYVIYNTQGQHWPHLFLYNYTKYNLLRMTLPGYMIMFDDTKIYDNVPRYDDISNLTLSFKN